MTTDYSRHGPYGKSAITMGMIRRTWQLALSGTSHWQAIHVTQAYVSAHVYTRQTYLIVPDRSRIKMVMEKRKKNPHAVALGRKGGRKGGPARAANMTPEQRTESARNAVVARWAKTKEIRDLAANKA
jgi:hypothetical protein